MKKICKCISTICTFCLSLTLLSAKSVHAEELASDVIFPIPVEDSIDEGDIFLADEFSMNNLSLKDESDLPLSSADIIDENVLDEIGDEPSESGSMYYGSFSDYLTGTNDYNLYPAQLNSGEYLQARLTPPNDYQIDYDLLLLNSNFQTIQSSDYITVTSGSSNTLAESIGYIASSNETVYVCVYSSAGGSTTLPYTLDFCVSTNTYDSNEPDENAHNATQLDISGAGATSSRVINSPLDNDWYSFTVLDDYKYDKIRFNIQSNSDINGCRFEIYKNVVSGGNYYGMLYLGEGTGGETPLDPGTYYLRIVSSNGLSNFDATSIPSYTLSVVPVSKVNAVEITDFSGFHGGPAVYHEGAYYRMEENVLFPNQARVWGRAWYYDEYNIPHPATNVKLNTTVLDRQWLARGVSAKAYTYGSFTTDTSGYFNDLVYFSEIAGDLHYFQYTMHNYDFLRVTVSLPSNDSINDIYDFYCDRDPLLD